MTAFHIISNNKLKTKVKTALPIVPCAQVSFEGQPVKFA